MGADRPLAAALYGGKHGLPNGTYGLFFQTRNSQKHKSILKSIGSENQTLNCMCFSPSALRVMTSALFSVTPFKT